VEEASGRLVGPPVFKTGVPATSRQAGSIPVRLREAMGVRTPSGMKQGWMHPRDSDALTHEPGQEIHAPP
jgi:hypothetical protein